LTPNSVLTDIFAPSILTLRRILVGVSIAGLIVLTAALWAWEGYDAI